MRKPTKNIEISETAEQNKGLLHANTDLLHNSSFCWERGKKGEEVDGGKMIYRNSRQRGLKWLM